jgi:hypothetical protein
MSKPIGYTSLITVGAALPIAVVAHIPTKSIKVREDNSVVGWPTTDFYVMKPSATSGANRYPLGYQYEFTNGEQLFDIGDIAGYIETVSGTTTFAQDEEGVV